MTNRHNITEIRRKLAYRLTRLDRAQARWKAEEAGVNACLRELAAALGIGFIRLERARGEALMIDEIEERAA